MIKIDTKHGIYLVKIVEMIFELSCKKLIKSKYKYIKGLSNISR